MARTELTAQIVATPRLKTNVWTSGPEDGTPLLMVHGNLSTGGFWRYVADALPEDVRVIAPDLRGFGASEAKPIDATRGLGDMVDDVHSLLETLGLAGQRSVNAVGWSMGAGVLNQMLLAHPDDLASITLIAPLSPYGFGATKGEDGQPVTDDFAGSGGGGANAAFVERLAAKDTSAEDPQASPRNVMAAFYGPGDNTEVDMDFLTDQLVMTQTGEDFYPGDSAPSGNWPMVSPGDRGVLNTMAPKHYNASAIADSEWKPPVLWLRGERDIVVSDRSMFDLATLGEMGAVPGWPGAEVMPPQPMDAQTRAVLGRYAANGGQVREVALDATHGMPLEMPREVADLIASNLVR
ncbi:alpha/beta fold hydrolase [Actinomycetota bacterium]